MNKEERVYTPQEEFVNAFSHALGAIFAIYAIIMLAVTSKTPLQTGTTAIYGASLFLLFEASTCYHAMTNETAKKVFRKIDHSAIYLLIAGTYTPVALCSIRPVDPVAGWTIFGIVWGLAIIGIVLCSILVFFLVLAGASYGFFSTRVTTKEYVVYTRNEKDANGNTTLYVSSVDRSGNKPKMGGVQSDEEWSRIKDVLRELAKND